MGNIEIKKMCETRAFYEFKDKNKKGEKIVVEITKIFPELTKGSLPMLWKEHGFTKNYIPIIFVSMFMQQIKKETVTENITQLLNHQMMEKDTLSTLIGC